MSDPEQPGWSFLTNHAHVLVCIADDAGMRVRDIAQRVGITERATQRIISDLVADGYVSRERRGRRNVYAVHGEQPFRHPLEQHREIGALLGLLVSDRR